jgi:hypothetical protein
MFVMGIGVSILLLAIAIFLYTRRVTVLGLGRDADGRNSVVLHLFPSAMSRVLVAAEWAKAHPEAEHVKVVLHGEQPESWPIALVLTMPRAALLALAADLGHGVLRRSEPAGVLDNEWTEQLWDACCASHPDDPFLEWEKQKEKYEL